MGRIFGASKAGKGEIQGDGMSYPLGQRVIKTFHPDMKRLMILTRKDKLEHGFNVCKKGNSLHEEQECTGNKCSITMLNLCDEGQRIGTFHTHPLGGMEHLIPSIPDVDYGNVGFPFNIVGLRKFNCIGSPIGKRDYVRCFDTESVRDELDANIKKQEQVAQGTLVTFKKSVGQIIEDGMKAKRIKYAEAIL